jgi:hypothetical protein
MSGRVNVFAVLILGLHALIHLLGATAYTQLAVIDGLPYKTAIFGGTWHIGEGGIFLFGVFWALAAFGFIAGTTAWVLKWKGWLALMMSVAMFSLVLTILDFEVATFGIAVNIAIIIMLLSNTEHVLREAAHA